MSTQLGKKAPDFVLNDQQGRPTKLSSFKGRKIILYFYPRDNTSGCTREACAFRDAKKQFDRKKAVIIGVSPDTEASHQRFIQKLGLPFILLADPDREAARLYGVYKKKSMYGKQVLGIERSTFLIDEKGMLIDEIRKVKVDGHIEDLLGRI